MISNLCYESYSVFYHAWFIIVVWMQLYAFFHLCQFLWAKCVFLFYLWRWPIESNATLSLFYIVQLAIGSWEFTELSSQNYIALWLEPWLLPHDITNTKSTCSHYLGLQKTGQTLQHSCFWGKGKPGVFCCTKAKLICSLGGLLMQLAQGDRASVNSSNIWRVLSGCPGVSGSTWEQQIWMRPRRREGCVWMWQNSLGSWPAPCTSLYCWWAWDADTWGIWHSVSSPHFNECTASTVSRLNESRGKREHIWKWILDFRSKRFRPRMGTSSRGERRLSSALL